MKKITIIIAAIAALVSFNSCKKEIERIQMPTEEGYMYTFVLKDVVTSATLDNGGVSWENTDKVGMYLEGYTGYADINTETTPNTAILYSPSIIPANSYAYAYYPYDSGNDDKTSNHIFLPNVQEGGSSSAMPLASIPFKIESEVAAKARPNGAIQFLNLGSVIDFRIYSSTYSSETIEYVTFTATSKKTLAGVDTDLAVSGDGYLDLTAIDTHDDTTVDLLFGLGTDYDYARVHNLSVPVADSKANASIPVYLVVAPGIYTGTITIGTDAATYTFDYSNKTLERNGIKKYNMNLDNAARVAGVVETVMPLPYSETFATSIGDFTTDGVQANSVDVWQFASGYGMKATSSFNSGEDKYNATSWLKSPWIDITSVSAAAVSFQHVHRYAGTASSEFTLWVLTDENNADWIQLTIPTYASGSNWNFVDSGEILLNDYVGHKVKLGFKYIGTTTNAGTWEIKNLSVIEKVYTTEFSMDAASISVEAGKTKNNHVTVNSGATIIYSSDDTDIATVNSDGVVTGVAAGSTTINLHVDANGLYPAKDDSFDVTVVPAVAYSDFTWDLSTNKTSSASTSSLNWYYRGTTMSLEKNTSGTNANNYCPPTQSSTRFYTNQLLTITPYSGSSIGYVEFEAKSENYANILKNSSWTNATASVDGTTVTVEPTTKTNAFSSTIGGTCGFSSVTVYYTGSLEPLANYTVTFSQPIETGCSFTVSVDDVDITSGDEVVTGKVVKLTPTAGSGYVFTSWTVTDAGSNSVTVTNNQFTMPSSNVTISATFTETGGDPTEKEYYKLNTTSTPVGTSNAYNAYKDIACANNLASYGTYPSTATWSTTCGSKQSNTSFWWGASNKQSAKMILSNGSVNGASGIATALGITTSATYYSALICSTNFANISKVVMTRSTPGGTAPSKIYLLKSTDDGSTWTKIGEENDAATVTFVVSTPYAASARYALVIYSTGYCQYKDPIITFYTTD